MASISIHQDLYNFEPKRKGFTNRQIKGFVSAAAVAVAITALGTYAAGFPVYVSVTIALCFAFVFAAVGFMPIWGMPAEEWADRFVTLNQRGNAITWEGPYVEPLKGEITRDYRKDKAARGCESQG